MFKVGQKVVTVEHEEAQHLSKGAVVTPPIIHHVNGGKECIVTGIIDDEMGGVEYEVKYWVAREQDWSYVTLPPEWLAAR